MTTPVDTATRNDAAAPAAASGATPASGAAPANGTNPPPPPPPMPAAVGVAAAIAEKVQRATNGAANGNGGSNGNGNGNGHAHMHSAAPQRPWSGEESARLYGIKNWGQGYFSVTPDGTVAVHPTQEPGKKIDLKKLVDELRERDIQLPCLIRFTDILKHRVDQIHRAFDRAIKDHDYRGDYRCVYPIKV
ncbi:MAG TPA: hypothetical protein VF796_23830, partial [Humisphaera sp.]